MNYLLCFLIYIYLAAGFIIGFKAMMSQKGFTYPVGKIILAILVGIYYAFLWLPELIADVASYITYKTR